MRTSQLTVLVAVVVLCVVMPRTVRCQGADDQGRVLAKLEGSVLDFATGDPLMFATVKAATDDVTLSVDTGVDGTFTFERLPRTKVTLNSTRVGYGPRSDSVDLEVQVDPVQIELTKSNGNQLYYEQFAATLHARVAAGRLTYDEALKGLSVSDFSNNARQLLAANILGDAPAGSRGQLTELLSTYDLVIDRPVVATPEVRFALGEAGLTDEAKLALDGFAASLAEANQNSYLEIQGYPDTDANAAAGRALAERRGEAVMGYLSSRHGLPLHRMNVVLVGDSASKDPGDPGGRVMIVVIE